MTFEQANAEAKRRYGPTAYVKISQNGLLDILVVQNDRKDMPYLLGWGRTWAEAFELAEIRAQWHKVQK
jgi:hypothetical protein